MSSKADLFRRTDDESYCKFGVERLAKLVEGFEGQIGGIIESKDIEYVHKMRVASRRIRATMPLFQSCFPPKKFKKWLKQIRKITRLLGEARDLDVQIAFIKEYLTKEKGTPESTGIEALLRSHKTRRVRIQPNVEKGLQQLQDSNVLTQIQEFFNSSAKNLANTPFNKSSVMQKAFWAISGKLDNFLAMEKWVHQEEDVVKHHEMRIKAKWLRYTMETFAPLYTNQLENEIERIKNFQDALGAMHDCDVWIGYIPKFLNKTRNKNRTNTNTKKSSSKQPFYHFLAYVKEQRQNHFRSFVELWDSSLKTRCFEELINTVNSGFPTAADKIVELEKCTESEIGVISDIHANLHALQAVIEDAEKRGINSFLNAGDLIGFGACPNEVIELLHSKNVLSVVGNYDLEVVQDVKKEKKEANIALDYARKQLSGSCKTYLLSLPKKIRLEIASKKILMTHATPESMEEHIYHDTGVERLREIAKEAQADVIIAGHSHDQFNREVEGTYFLNPGSVGRPGDGNPQTAYAMMKLKPFSIELLRIDYDVIAAAQALRERGLPESFSQMLLNGTSIDEIIVEDNERKGVMGKNCTKIVECCEEVSSQYWQDIEHFRQVRKLSVRIFSELQTIHKYANREKCWLECAAILHDIGISKMAKAHNKESMTLILNDKRLLLPSEDRRIIASIARYHRKGFPKNTHYNLASLKPKTIQKIGLLSAILRVADSLDYTHNAIVKNITVKKTAKRMTFQCSVAYDPSLEEQAFNKKKDLMEQFLKRKLVLAWKRL